ncbi:hypothetical protein [Methylobacter sp. YRD-M1]|uniref:hypothetical protein n=1 Tax=Methylobacter sp. YRD-M1 TaxID=2911520 RepID=UPI00227B9F60|nr:hypothetical protein [Methylobacter sp. YRD-M1]WAK03281.1 hypothetical protein LZ558_05715 [Methylobacter sp. YRD-M1]
MKFPLFKKRPAHSLLFITEAKTFRVDFDKTGVLIGDMSTADISCPTTAKLAECVAQIAAGSKPLGRKVWLLYMRLPIALLTIPSMQVEGVDEATLLQALQFELEGLTGQSALDAKLAYHLLSNKDEMSTYWVSQINQLHFEDIHKALKKAGSQLGGLLHPAAMPQSLANPEHEDWLRMECWSRQLVAMRRHPDGGFSMQLFSLDYRHWHTQLEQWLNEQGAVPHSETLLNNMIELLPETAYTLHLGNTERLPDWLALWAGSLAKKTPPPAPMLRYQSKLNTDLLLMASGGSVAVLICAGHLSWNLYQAQHFTQEAEALKKVETSMTALRKSSADDREKRDKLKTKLDKLKGDSKILPEMIKALQHRPSRLMAAIASGRPENLVLEEIIADNDDIKIRGVSLDSVSTNKLAGYLELKLADLGWEILAPTKKNMNLFEDGGPWEFEIALRDKGIEGFHHEPKKQ